MTYPILEQPRTHRGRHAPGWTLYTRWDGAKSWVRWVGIPDQSEPPTLREIVTKSLRRLAQFRLWGR
jgi:hypothetical protein